MRKFEKKMEQKEIHSIRKKAEISVAHNEESELEKIGYKGAT